MWGLGVRHFSPHTMDILVLKMTTCLGPFDPQVRRLVLQCRVKRMDDCDYNAGSMCSFYA